MKRPPSKRLWGFGWPGWCLLAIALGLGSCLVLGFDLRHQILRLIAATLGVKAMNWFVSSWIAGEWMFDFPFLPVWQGAWGSVPPSKRFSLITMSLMLIVMHVHPKRFGWPKISTLVLMGVVLPGMTTSAIQWIGRGAAPLGTLAEPWFVISTVLSLEAVLAAAVLAWIFTLRIGAICAAFLLIGVWMTCEELRRAAIPPLTPLLININGTSPWIKLLGWIWNPLLFSYLLFWAIRARVGRFPQHACQACGYDLRGSVEDICPECGQESSAALQHIVNPPSTQIT